MVDLRVLVVLQPLLYRIHGGQADSGNHSTKAIVNEKLVPAYTHEAMNHKYSLPLATIRSSIRSSVRSCTEHNSPTKWALVYSSYQMNVSA